MKGFLRDDDLALFADLDGPGVLAGGIIAHIVASLLYKSYFSYSLYNEEALPSRQKGSNMHFHV